MAGLSGSQWAARIVSGAVRAVSRPSLLIVSLAQSYHHAARYLFQLVLQAVEMSVGVGVGLVMLAREGLSFAALKRMEEQEETSAEDALEELEEAAEADYDEDADRELVTRARSRR